MNTLLCMGFGYCAHEFARRLDANGDWRIVGTSRSPSADGTGAQLLFDGETVNATLAQAIATTTHLLVSAAPGPAGDPVLSACKDLLAKSATLRWIGYLSTIGVYGDTGGAWVDETTPPQPRQDRAVRRVAAEREWLDLAAQSGFSAQIFRIAGIYGPGRSILEDLADGTAKRVVKPGQVFNRIHVADIARALEAAMERGQPGTIYNLTDDEPASPEDVLLYAAALLGIAPPPPVPFDAAALSPMALSFYAENRRVKNDRIKRDLALTLDYPTYREGLAAIHASRHRGVGA